ncbi:aspartate/glutamate racemase family protein [Paracandidimonas soli]|uniref:aspartate/glutamate racemase family protein n=1 Tax=Paracandidimonas soli TaxID=1917182 RepID=UPI000AF9DF09
MEDAFDGPFLGILGGMGPLASATLMTRLTQLTPAETDQAHIPAILWSDPRIPDRPAAYLRQGEDPFPWMLNGIRRLEAAGAKIIVIPCNTAHLWYDALAAQARVPIIHIVDAVVQNLQAQGVPHGRVGLMATSATLQSGLYQSRLSAHGYECLVPEPEEIGRHCSIPIALTKQGHLEEARRAASPGVASLCDRGAQAIVLGCTELPLALPHAMRGSWEVPIVDSIDALAHAAIHWHRRQTGKRKPDD